MAATVVRMSGSVTHTCVVCEASPGLREGLRMRMQGASNLLIVGEAATSDDALDVIRERRPFLVLASDQLPGRGIFHVLEELAASGASTRVMVLTTRATPDHVGRLIEFGAAALIGSNGLHDLLGEAVDAVIEGTVFIAPQIVLDMLASSGAPLTEDEFEVVRLAGVGTPWEGVTSSMGLADVEAAPLLASVHQKIAAALGPSACPLAFRFARSSGWPALPADSPR